MQSIDLFFQGKELEIPIASLWALAGFRLIHEQPKDRKKGVDVLQCWFCGSYIDESREFKSILGSRGRPESSESDEPGAKRQKVHAPENIQSFTAGLDEFPLENSYDMKEDSQEEEEENLDGEEDEMDSEMYSDPLSDHAPLPILQSREGQSVEKTKLVEVRVLEDKVADPYRQHQRFCMYLNDGGWALTLQHILSQRLNQDMDIQF
jgi:hypothetical protein